VSDAQLIDVDLAAGTLAVRGRIRGAGDLRRATSAQARVLALKSRALTVANVNDRDNPSVTAELELTRYVQKFAVADGIGLQYIAQWDGYMPANSELRAVPLHRYDAEKDQVLSRISTGLPVGDLFVNGRKAYVVARTWVDGKNLVHIKVFDFADAAAPRALGEIQLAADEGLGEFVTRYPIIHRFNYQAAMQVRPGLLVVSTASSDGPAFHVVSLRDPSQPRLVETVKLTAGASLLDMQAFSGALYVTDYEVLPGAEKVPVEGAKLASSGSASEMPPSFRTRQKCTIISTEATIGMKMQWST
jgi:hypothetical protein